MAPPLRAAAALGLSLRPMTDDDLPFVADLYASTRTDELSGTGWPPEMQQAFLRQQHDAQHRHYRMHYPGAEWLVVELSGAAVGRLYLFEQEQEMSIIDISLVPAARGRGLGGALMEDLMAAAASAGRSVSLHVERTNPALRLYQRLGFALVEDKGVYLQLSWKLPPG